MRKRACFLNSIGEQAADAYRRAGRAAREAGQLQKAITYGEKALEMAEKSKIQASCFRY